MSRTSEERRAALSAAEAESALGLREPWGGLGHTQVVGVHLHGDRVWKHWGVGAED